MNITSKGRYALRVMLDLASHTEDGFISLKTIADRQGISMKYLEAIVASLARAELVESKRGKAGGYRLGKKPEEVTVADVVRAAEGGISPVACPECDGSSCSRSGRCLTVDLWKHLDDMIERYLSAVTLADLLEGKDLQEAVSVN